MVVVRLHRHVVRDVLDGLVMLVSAGVPDRGPPKGHSDDADRDPFDRLSLPRALAQKDEQRRAEKNDNK